MVTLLTAKGFGIGFCLSLFVGPAGLVCIRQTLTKGRLYGALAGLGIATADALFASVALYSIDLLTGTLTRYRTTFEVGGAIVIGVVGMALLLHKPTTYHSPALISYDLLSTYLWLFFLTISNPLSILLFAATFATLKIDPSALNMFECTRLIGGLMVGASTWWILVSQAAELLRSRLTLQGMIWFHRLSGGVLVCAASMSLIHLFFFS